MEEPEPTLNYRFFNKTVPVLWKFCNWQLFYFQLKKKNLENQVFSNFEKTKSNLKLELEGFRV
jgi:hypothetical protein